MDKYPVALAEVVSHELQSGRQHAAQALPVQLGGPDRQVQIGRRSAIHSPTASTAYKRRVCIISMLLLLLLNHWWFSRRAHNTRDF